MAEEDDSQYRRRIAEVLIRHGFGWVVAQAEAQIAEGKPSSKQVSEREFVHVTQDPLFTIRRPRSRRASLITTEPYTESERLGILLHAVEAAIVQRSMIEQVVLEQLHDVSAIRFERDSPAEGGEDSFGVSHTLDAARRARAIELESQAKDVLGRMKERDRADT